MSYLLDNDQLDLGYPGIIDENWETEDNIIWSHGIIQVKIN